jgi:hypothetical protein
MKQVAYPWSGEIGPRQRTLLFLSEVIDVNRKEEARQLAGELGARLGELESLGALVAAAHLDVAIDALCKEFNVERNTSTPD